MMLLFQPRKSRIEQSIRAAMRSFGARALLALMALGLFLAGTIFLGIVAHAQLVKAFGLDTANFITGCAFIAISGLISFLGVFKRQKPLPVLAVEATPAKSSSEMLASLAFTAAFVAARQMRKP
jgi:hypothetical protein